MASSMAPMSAYSPVHNIRDDILALSGSEASGTIEFGQVRTRTHSLIKQAGDEVAQARLIQDVLEVMVDGTEMMNKVLSEAWGMFMDDGLWRSLFESKEQALAAIGTTQLKDLRKRATTNRNRKSAYFKTFQKAWGIRPQSSKQSAPRSIW